MTRFELGLLICGGVLTPTTLITHLRASEQFDQLQNRMLRAETLAADASCLRSLSSDVRPAAADATNQEITQTFVAALRSGGIDPARVVSVLPQPPRRRPGCDLVEVTHRVLLDGAELRGLAGALEELQRTAPWMPVTSIQLRAIPGNATQWNVDLGLTVSRYAPEYRSASSRS